MSELAVEDERVQNALEQLMHRLRSYIGEPLTEITMHAIRGAVEEARTEFKKTYSHEFPPLVPLILPSSRFVAWFRQDLENDEVRIKVLNLLREFSLKKIPVSAFELSQAMRLTWPQYNADDGTIEFYRNAKQVTLLQ
jgi:hypothetical protein